MLPIISAVICTHNRASYVRKAIQSLVAQSIDASRYEILVVDNCSSDNTKSVVTEQFADVQNLKYIFEPELGLSVARNTGWKAAQGSYIAYLDDDAIASSTWLETILNGFQTFQPEPGCIGGKIEPIWEAPRPDWLPNQFLPYLTVVDLSETSFLLDDTQYVAGANMAFSKAALEKIGGFNADFGRKGKNLLSNEEVVVQNQVRQLGMGVYYDPAADIQHHVVAARLQQKWFVERAYWQGVSKAFLIKDEDSLSPTERLKLILQMGFKLLMAPHGFVALLISSNNPRLAALKFRTTRELGYIVGLATANHS